MMIRSSLTSSAVSSFGVFIITLFIYLKTMRPGMSGGDAMEFACCACNKSVAHPPGYPLWLAILSAALRIPLDVRPVLMFNTIAAIASALACAVLHLAVLKITSNVRKTQESVSYTAAWIAAIGFGMSPTVRLYAAQPEIFALNNLFAAILLYSTFWLFDNPVPYRLWVCALISGLSTTNQHTMVLYIIPVAVYIAYRYPHLMKLPVLASASCAFLVGILPAYLWLAMLSITQPPHSWGDLSKPAGLIRHFLRQDYGSSFQLVSATSTSSSSDGVLWRLFVYFRHLIIDDLAVISVPITLVGFFTSTQLRFVTVLPFAYMFYTIVFHALANLSFAKDLNIGVVSRFWMQPLMIVFVFVALGFQRLTRNLSPSTVAVTIKSGLGLLALVVALGWSKRDFSSDRALDIYGHSLLDTVPDNGILLVHGDLETNLSTYLQSCEGVRRDISIISMGLMTWPWFVNRNRHHYPDVVFPGNRFHPILGGFSLEQFLDANMPHRPITICGPIPQWNGQDLSQSSRYRRIFNGVCSSIVYAVDGEPNVAQIRRGLLNVPDLSAFCPAIHGADSWEREAYQIAWTAQLNLFDQLGPLLNSTVDDSAITLASSIAASIISETRFPVSSDDLWHATIVYGLLSQTQKSAEFALVASARRLLTVDPDHESAKGIVLEKFNPWRQQKISSL